MTKSLLGAASGVSGDAWQAISQIVGQIIITVGALVGIILTARYGNKRRREGMSIEVDEVEHRDDPRVRSLSNEVTFLEEQLVFTQRQLSFERRRNQSLEQENDSAWQIIRNLQAQLQRGGGVGGSELR